MANPDDLIAGRYLVDLAAPMPGAAGGLTAFGVRDQSTGDASLMAVLADRQAPPRAHALQVLTRPLDGVLAPVAHGRAPAPQGQAGYYVVCPAPPGPPLAAQLRPWAEASLIDRLLRPAATVLNHLETLGLTHRGIRLNNLYHPGPGHPVALGQAWAAPPGLHQPALFEPPYSAMCLPAGRGPGRIADDVYALGVVLLCLALGRTPMAGLDDAAIVRRKLELGSYGALVGDERLPPIVADLLRGMLAEDPEHRPGPSLLLDPGAARGRRVAARPPRHAQRALTIGGASAWDARTLAYAIASEPEQGAHALRNGTAVQWLRRELGDAAMAVRIDDLVRHRAPDTAEEPRNDAMLGMRAVALLDPLAPLCWRGVRLWPDGIGPALTAATLGGEAQTLARLEELISSEAAASWAMSRPDRCDSGMLRIDARQNRAVLQTRGMAGGMTRLLYTLNPLLPCLSPHLAGKCITHANQVLPALEAALAAGPGSRLIDPHLVSFIAARVERGLDAEINAFALPQREATNLVQMRLLSQMQEKLYRHPLPALAGWMVAEAEPLLAFWRNRDRRTELAQRLRGLAEAGRLAPMLALLEDPAGRGADERAAAAAEAELARIDAELAAIESGGPIRAGEALRFGQELAAGLGLSALATMLAITALG